MENLTPREKETLEKFTQYRKKNPTATVQEVFKATGTNSATLHQAKVKAGLIQKKKPVVAKSKPGPKLGSKQKKKSPPTMHTFAVQEPTPKNFAVIVCNQSNLQDVLNAIG